MRARTACTTMLVAALASAPAGAADIPVDGNPIATITDAIAQAVDGDRILVDPGTYAECIDTFGKRLEIVSTEWLTSGTNAATILDGGGVNGCGYSLEVVYLDAGSTFTGFTVRGGLNTGIRAYEAAVITNNLITGNEGLDGGGLYVGDTATVRDNRITGNLAVYYGGGLFLKASDEVDGFEAEMLVRDNRIDDNEALLDGGGAYVYALALTGAGPPIRMEQNVVERNTADGFGGGMVVTTFAEAGANTSIRVTRNTITDNSVTGAAGYGAYIGYGGGIWATTYGPGEETIVLDENTVRANSTTTSGGGLSLWVQTVDPDLAPTHEVRAEANEIASNTSGGDGGGLDLYVEGRSLAPGSSSMRLRSERNRIRSNRASGTFGLGGGVFALARAERSGGAGEIDLSMVLDELTDNRATVGGGGAALLAQAFADPDPVDPANPPPPLRSVAAVRMENVLVRGNTAADPSQASAAGGGVLAYVDFDGSDGVLADDGGAAIDLARLTVANNTSDIGGAVEIESIRTRTTSGTVAVSVRDSILTGNDSYGIGGPAPGTSGNVTFEQSPDLVVNVRYDDLFSNASGDLESTIVPDDATGTIFADPLLDADLVPARCSPTIDGGDPMEDAGAEPAYNGGRINMGRFGGTEFAERSLSDLTGDRIVDGFDVIQVTTRFGSSAADPPGSPYLDSLDLDGNGMIDGVELALVAADFGVECAP